MADPKKPKSDPVANLREGYEEAAEEHDGKLIYEWPADFPYGPEPQYEGSKDGGLFSPEERKKPLNELPKTGGTS